MLPYNDVRPDRPAALLECGAEIRHLQSEVELLTKVADLAVTTRRTRPVTIYRRAVWRFGLTVLFALDDGWSEVQDGPVRRVAFADVSTPNAPGRGVVLGKFLFALQWLRASPVSQPA